MFKVEQLWNSCVKKGGVYASNNIALNFKKNKKKLGVSLPLFLKQSCGLVEMQSRLLLLCLLILPHGLFFMKITMLMRLPRVLYVLRRVIMIWQWL